MANIGNAYGKFGDFDRQREYLERALEIETSRYDIYVDAAKTYGKLGELGKQRAFLEHAMQMIERQYGDIHEDLAPILILLGDMRGDVKISVDWTEAWEDSLQQQLVKYASARDLTLDALTGIVKVTDKRSRDVTMSFDSEGRASITAIQKDPPPPENVSNTGFFKGLPPPSLSKNDRRGSMPLSVRPGEAVVEEDALAYLGEEDARPRSRSHQPTATNQGDNLHNQSSVDAEVEDDAQTEEESEVCEHFPLLVQADGDAARQRQFYERALYIREGVYGTEHCELVVALTKLGNVWGRLGVVEHKYELLERALNIQLKELGPKHREVAVIRFNLAHALYTMGDLEEALKLMRKAKAGMQANFGEKHRHTQSAERAIKQWTKQSAEKESANSTKYN